MCTEQSVCHTKLNRDPVRLLHPFFNTVPSIQAEAETKLSTNKKYKILA